MAGLYLHIPFCKQACYYCNFHFSTSLSNRDRMLEALLQEIDLRKHYLEGQRVQTVYLGGGTPSLLGADALNRLFDHLFSVFDVQAGGEITLEANPDDLSPAYLQALRSTPVNRLSIGVQSFAEADLRWMNRAHNATEALDCIRQAQDQGYTNLTIDLIYGAPVTSDATWAQNIATATSLGIPHLSCYCLTVEPGTALSAFVKKGKVAPVDDDRAGRQFEYLMQTLETAGYEHYEISNFALPGCHARHNTAYWEGAHYLGIGPSAHSYNGRSRQWNVANNMRYLRSIEAGTVPFESETLSDTQLYNEYVMTALRTSRGCSLARIGQWGAAAKAHFIATIRPFVDSGHVHVAGDSCTLTRSGRLLADRIAMELFLDAAEAPLVTTVKAI